MRFLGIGEYNDPGAMHLAGLALKRSPGTRRASRKTPTRNGGASL